jgi:phosphatidylserine decarboxylase
MRFQTLYEGRHIFAVIAAIGVVGWILSAIWPSALIGQIVMWLATALVLFCLNFFRDPERPIPEGEELVLSAADGVVADIVEIEETEVLKTKCLRVGVFLSVFDVHVNRAPIDGKITYVRHHPGLFLDARDPQCSEKNEAMTWAFEGKNVTLVVRQLTGAIARRIVPWSKVGDEVPRGHRFGMIRFGSRTEVYLPLNAKLKVAVGDRVSGVTSIIAHLPKSSSQAPRSSVVQLPVEPGPPGSIFE